MTSRTSTMFPAISMPRRTFLRSTTCGSSPAWALTWSASAAAKAFAARRTPAFCSARSSLIDLAAANNNPGDGVGRGMKVAKEQIVGMVAAVDWILAQTDEGMDREDTRRANVISSMVKDIPTMQASVMIPPAENQVPHLILTYDPAVVGVTPREVAQRLQDGTPVSF